MDRSEIGDLYWKKTNEIKKDILRYLLEGKSRQEIAKEVDRDASRVGRILTELFDLFLGPIPKEEWEGLSPSDKQATNKAREEKVAKLLYCYDENLVTAEGRKKYHIDENTKPDFPGGNMHAKQDLYVERSPIESVCYETVLQPGSLIRIKGPKKMGKTLLMNHILQYASQNSYQTVRLNILRPEKAVIENLKSFLLWLCDNAARRLKISEQVTDIWKDSRGANDNCTIYFEECVLDKIDQPLVLGLDNVDRVFQYPDVAADFFGLLRSWFEDAKVRDIWKKMRLVVAYSTEVYIPFNVNNSPFNVGDFVELPEFNKEQVGLLAREYNLNLKPSHIDKLMALVGGHPYLVKAALENLKEPVDVSLEELLLAAPTNAGIYRSYLTEINQYLQDNPELATALKKVLEAEEPVRLTDEEAFKLDSLGLVNKDGNDVTLRFDLYRNFFADRLI